MYDALTNVGKGVTARFQITQHSRDTELMKFLEEYFNCGYLLLNSNKPICDFYVKKLPDIVEKIIPFFEEYPLIGSKFKDYEDFKRVVNIMEVKGHLTSEGLDEIIRIKSGMNRRREN